MSSSDVYKAFQHQNAKDWTNQQGPRMLGIVFIYVSEPCIFPYILIYTYICIYWHIYIYSDVNHSDVNHTQNSNGIASLFNLHEPAAPGRRHGFSLHEPNVNEAISWCSSGFGGVARGMMYGVVLDWKELNFNIFFLCIIMSGFCWFWCIACICLYLFI